MIIFCWTELKLLSLYPVLSTDSCIRRPQCVCELLWPGKKANLSLEQIAARISNGKQIKVTFIFVALLGCQWPFLNGACKAGDCWTLPHQPCQGWDVSGSHRNARTKQKNPLIQQQNPAIRCPCRSCCFIVYQTFKEANQKQKKTKQTHHKMRKRGFSRRRFVLKMWERAAELICTEWRRIWPHTHTQKYSMCMHGDLLSVFCFWGEFH